MLDACRVRMRGLYYQAMICFGLHSSPFLLLVILQHIKYKFPLFPFGRDKPTCPCLMYTFCFSCSFILFFFLPLIVSFLFSLSLSSSGNINVKMPSNKTQLTEEEVQGWGLNEVSGWLKSAKLESCIEEFHSLQIDGQRLLVNKQCIIA